MIADKDKLDLLRPGAEVVTPNGKGKVAHVRMAPPDYAQVQAVSVVLHARAHECCYAGTMFQVGDISAP